MLWIANTDFEFELANQNIAENHLTLQLQYLPVLFAEANDEILVTTIPEPSYIEYLKTTKINIPHFVSVPSRQEVSSWGASQKIKHWATEKGFTYSIPPWKTVIEVNSKEFVYHHAPRLPGSAILRTTEEVESWINQSDGKKVLKTCFGLSSKGHFFIEPLSKFHLFLDREFKQGFSVIGEPWVKRKLDFSSHWKIDPDRSIHYLGVTKLLNTSRGSYIGTMVGNEKQVFESYLPFLEVHKNEVVKLLLKVAEKGYFGFAGIDAMVYCLPENMENDYLHPIVELNARMSMGLAALLFQKRYFPDKMLTLRYCNEESNGLLPIAVKKNGKLINFKRQIIIDLA